MAYVVADPCIKCKYTDCVAVCPVECFYEGKNSLVIHPDECIDCGACEPECPTTAIFEESALPDKWKAFKDINAVLSGAKSMGEADHGGWPQKLVTALESSSFETWPTITATKPALPEADAAATEENKLGDLDPAGGA
jgi:ferredoxin